VVTSFMTEAGFMATWLCQSRRGAARPSTSTTRAETASRGSLARARAASTAGGRRLSRAALVDREAGATGASAWALATPGRAAASSAAASPWRKRGNLERKTEEIEEEDGERCNMAGKSTPVIAALPRAGRAGRR
jgi:hypothetical protein